MSILTGTCPSCLKNKFLTEGRPFPNKRWKRCNIRYAVINSDTTKNNIKVVSKK
jgi:hypothetical protein